jgi:hypothetical protein
VESQKRAYHRCKILTVDHKRHSVKVSRLVYQNSILKETHECQKPRRDKTLNEGQTRVKLIMDRIAEKTEQNWMNST